MPTDPTGLPRIVTRQEALDAGLTRDQVRQRVRGGHWARLATGAYVRSSAQADDDFAHARRAHVDRCIAAARCHEGATIGFASAALAWGLPLVTGVPDLGQILVPLGGWTGIRDGIRYRAGSCLPEQIIRWDPNESGTAVRVTTPARTLVDVARTMPPCDAVAVGDAGLRLGLASRTDALGILEGMYRVRGRRTAARIVSFWDPRRETALESWSAQRFREWGLPAPTPQVTFVDEDGFIGRVDFFWERAGIVGEADGRLKYSAAAVLYAEKRREDRLRRQVNGVIRWGWSDLSSPSSSALRHRLERCLR